MYVLSVSRAVEEVKQINVYNSNDEVGYRVVRNIALFQ
jgi:hypothetical protein